jgi:hypothetical protein
MASERPWRKSASFVPALEIFTRWSTMVSMTRRKGKWRGAVDAVVNSRSEWREWLGGPLFIEAVVCLAPPFCDSRLPSVGWRCSALVRVGLLLFWA